MFEDRKYLVSVIALLLLWVASGVYGGVLAYGVILISAILLWLRGRFTELFIGFWLILILSDSLAPGLIWAKSLKNIYILFMAMVLVVDRRDFAPLPGIFKMFVPFFAVAVFVLLFSPVIVDAAQRTLSYILIFAIVPSFAMRIFRERGAVFFKELVWFGAVIVILGLLSRYINPSLAISHGGRLRGLFGNPNGLGLFLIVIFILFYATDHLFKGQFSRLERWMERC